MGNVPDEVAIADLLARLAIATDEGTLDEYASCFSEDAVLVTDPQLALPGREILRGADIRRAAEDRRAAGSGPGSGIRHVVTNVTVRVDGDDAESTAYWSFYRRVDGQPVLAAIGQYRDRFRQDPEGWRLSHREITLDGD